MAGTYKLIQAQTLSSSQSSVTFSSIPATYTDLVFRISARTNLPGANQDINVQYNSSTGANYSQTTLLGNGTAADSYRSTNASTDVALGTVVGATATANTFNSLEFYIPNYAGSTRKPSSMFSVAENNSAAQFNTYIYTAAGNWALTNAITEIKFSVGSYSFVSGSSFYLYGIENVNVVAKATGGSITSDGTYFVHTFTASDTFTPKENLSNVEYLVIAGGSGGTANGGGGGAGGYRSSVTGQTSGGGASAESKLSLTANTAYTVTVGAGGTYGISGGAQDATAGNNSVFGSITSLGGGLGGGVGGNGQTGGSGGGAGRSGSGSLTGGSGTSGQGYGGGNNSSNFLNAGGGGGAGAVGVTAATGAAGNGGAGQSSTITGTSVTRAGGGGGGANSGNTNSSGGTGGGGAGAGSSAGSAGSGTVNTGSGGGATGAGSTTGDQTGAGGSGIVIVRYAI
jgi:hypothetical protein